MNYIAGIEAGGTKCHVVVGTAEGDIVAKERIATTDPKTTLINVVRQLQKFQKSYDFRAIGIGAFGPADVDQQSPMYGYITTSPKPGWQMIDVVGAVKAQFDLPIAFDTDVNAAALGEYYWGQAQGKSHVIYITIGTGIGTGIVVDGKPLHGAMHPESGHMLIRRHPDDDSAGYCPFHGDCWEGLASGLALQERWNVVDAAKLPDDHSAWQMQAYYVAVGIVNLILAHAPQCVILGGGVMQRQGLMNLVRMQVQTLLASYLDNAMVNHLSSTVVLASLGQDAGVRGVLALAKGVL